MKDNTKASLPLTAVSDVGYEFVLNEGEGVKSQSGRKKEVGLFYFIWHGAEVYQSLNFNTYEILQNLPDGHALGRPFNYSEWQAAGGGPRGTFHYWSKPLLGYYSTRDAWVIEKHVRMFIEAKIDYLVLDLTNGVCANYIESIETLFAALDKFAKLGENVPKVTMMGNDDGPGTLNTLYAKFYSVHPEYAHLFYHWDNHDKPLLLDNISGYSKTAAFIINKDEKLAMYDKGVTDMFEIMDVAFPHETKVPYHVFPAECDSFLYLDFRPEPKKVTTSSGESFINISLAEIEGTNHSSELWFNHETKDRSRSWDGTQNRHLLPGEENASAYGINFARQCKIALSENPDNVFITGWNEWVAQLQTRGEADSPVTLIDNADPDNSRDIEPMEGGYKDNYFIQLCKFVSDFKGLGDKGANAYKTDKDMMCFDAWNNANIPSYKNAPGNIANHNFRTAYNGNDIMVDNSGRNDFVTTKVCDDAKNIYFYIETKDAIKDAKEEKAMTLFVSTGASKVYDITINRSKMRCGKAFIEQREAKDGLALNEGWNQVGKTDVKSNENAMIVALPKDILRGATKISFKWADNYGDDIMTFYKNGSSMPYGRLNLLYTMK